MCMTYRPAEGGWDRGESRWYLHIVLQEREHRSETVRRVWLLAPEQAFLARPSRVDPAATVNMSRC